MELLLCIYQWVFEYIFLSSLKFCVIFDFYKFQIFSNRTLCYALNGLDHVVSGSMSIQSHNLICFAAFLYILYSTVSCVLLIKGIAFRAHSWYFCVKFRRLNYKIVECSRSVDLSAWPASVLSDRLRRYSQCLFVDGGDIKLNAYNEPRFRDLQE